MRSLLFLILLVGCRDRGPITPTSYTLRGTLHFTDFDFPFPPESFGGDVQIFLFATGDEGYCLDPNATIGIGYNVIKAPDLQTLKTDGIPYELAIPEAPALVYPYDVYVLALWQNTSALTHVCETNGRFNAAGFSGLGQLDYAAGATSPCCGFQPKGITIDARGAVIEDVDLLMVPQALSPAACVAEDAPSDVCTLRHPPGQTFGDSACYLALGDAASTIFVERDAAGKITRECP